MDRSEVVALLSECEKRFDIAEALIADVNIWPLIKIKIGEQLIATEMAKSNENSGSGNKTFKSIKGGLDLLSAGKKLQKFRDVLFLSTLEHWVPTSSGLAERYAHPYFDLLDKLDKEYGIVHLKSRPAGVSIKPCQELDLQNAIYMSSLIWWKTRKKEGLPIVIRDLLKWIGSQGHEVNDQYLQEMTHTMLFYADLFEKLLKNSGIGNLFMVCFYAVHNMGSSIAAHRLGIKTIDIQHGVQGPSHLAYGNWDLPKSGYGSLPEIFWCWDQNDADHINNWANNTTHSAINGGDLWHEFVSDSEDETELPDIKPGNKVVLYTLQNTADPYPKDLVAAIRSSTDIDWWIREHPMHRKDPDEFSAELNELGILELVERKGISDAPIPLVLSKVDVHITSWSSVVLDAERAGVPSILIHPTGKDVFANLIEQKRAKYISTGHKDLLEAIQQAGVSRSSLDRKGSDALGQLRSILT